MKVSRDVDTLLGAASTPDFISPLVGILQAAVNAGKGQTIRLDGEIDRTILSMNDVSRALRTRGIKNWNQCIIDHDGFVTIKKEDAKRAIEALKAEAKYRRSRERDQKFGQEYEEATTGSGSGWVQTKKGWWPF